MQTDEKVKIIKRARLFSGLSKAELREIAAAADEVELPQGQVLTEEGKPGGGFFVVLAGEVEVRQRDRLLRTLTKGDFFGEIAVVSKLPRTATVTATAPTRALHISDDAFRVLLDRSPKIERRIAEAFAARLGPELI